LVKASCRNRCSGAPRDQGSNPLVGIVGWLYTRSGAIVASDERLLDPVTCCWRGNSGGWLGDVCVDIGIGPIFLSAKGE
jgi:hypothetical protein